MSSLSPTMHIHCQESCGSHHNDVIMGSMASQITSLAIVYSAVYSGADERKIKAPSHWPLCGNSLGTGEFPAQMAITRKMFHLMTSLCGDHGLDYYPAIISRSQYNSLQNSPILGCIYACRMFISIVKNKNICKYLIGTMLIFALTVVYILRYSFGRLEIYKNRGNYLRKNCT